MAAVVHYTLNLRLLSVGQSHGETFEAKLINSTAMRTAKGRGNDARKILTYFRANFGIHAPYSVLFDGTLIYASVKRNINLKTSLPKLLGGDFQPSVTKCVTEELRALGEDFAEASMFARKSTHQPCTHGTETISAHECIESLLANGNPRRLMLATNDRSVVRKAVSWIGVPVLTLVNETRLVLKKPSDDAIAKVSAVDEEKSSALRPDEKALIAKVNEELRANRPPRKQTTFKRKRAQGPNPLSMKKSKKQKPNQVKGIESGPREGEGTPVINENESGCPGEKLSVKHDQVNSKDNARKGCQKRKRRKKKLLDSEGS